MTIFPTALPTLDALKRTPQYQESSQQDLHQMLREKDEQLHASKSTHYNRKE